jgi:hypothetical protein
MKLLNDRRLTEIFINLYQTYKIISMTYDRAFLKDVFKKWRACFFFFDLFLSEFKTPFLFSFLPYASLFFINYIKSIKTLPSVPLFFLNNIPLRSCCALSSFLPPSFHFLFFFVLSPSFSLSFHIAFILFFSYFYIMILQVLILYGVSIVIRSLLK